MNPASYQTLSFFPFCSKISHLPSQLIVKPSQSAFPSHCAVQTALVMLDNDLHIAAQMDSLWSSSRVTT